MEEEASLAKQDQEQLTRNQLISMIKNAYSASTQPVQKTSQDKIMTLLKTPGFLQKLFSLLTDPSELCQKNELDKAAAVLIKKYSYQMAKTNEDKSIFIQMLLNLLLCQKIDFGAKQLLGIALEFQFNVDIQNFYRKTVIQNSLKMMEVRENVINLQGYMLICIAFLNSIVEIQNQIQFFLYSMNSINCAAINLLQQIEKISSEQWVLKEKVIMPKINKIFQYIEIATERIIDEQPYIQTELKLIRQNTHLLSTLEKYLLLFNNNGSMISVLFPPINLVKKMIINVVSLLYSNDLCPTKLFNSIYVTFLVECQFRNRDCIAESILISCFQILSIHLEKKYYYKVYTDNLMQTILALFMYSSTTKQQYEALDNNPQEFSDIAQYYVKGEQKYYNLKVKASIFIHILVFKIDQAMKQMLEILLVILAGALETISGDTQIMSEVKAQTSKFDFYGLSNDQKLETSLMVLCSLSRYVNRRNDIGQIVYAFFVTQFSAFTKPSSPIVVLRLMRAISCYPTALYFVYMEQQIKRGKVFAIEGLKCFGKIVKTNKFDQLFIYLAKIITQILEHVSVTDEIMELIIYNNFEKMVKVTPNLFRAILKKIKQQFYKNIKNNQHQTLICFNLIHGLMSKNSSQQYQFQILQLFYEIAQFLMQTDNQSLFKKFDEKIVQFLIVILESVKYIPEQVDRFIQFSLSYLPSIDIGSQYFRFYSIYIFQLSGSTYKLQPIFYSFITQTKRRFEVYQTNQKYNEGISYFCFLMSQIIGNYCKIDLSEENMKFFLKMAEKLPSDHKQYPLVVFLTHLYQMPYPVCSFLKQNSFYTGFLNQIVKISFQTGLIKRIFILSLIKLLEIEEDVNIFKSILIYCIDHLKKQNNNNKVKKFKQKIYQDRPRKLGEQPFKIGPQQCIEGEMDDNQLVNLFVRFKHPFNNLSQYDQFKVVFWQNDSHISHLTPEIKADLKTILETEWVENKTRRIVHVKK